QSTPLQPTGLPQSGRPLLGNRLAGLFNAVPSKIYDPPTVRSSENQMKTKRKKQRNRKKGDGHLHPRVIISGYYGFDNLGDELILRVLIEELKSHKIHI